MSRNYITAMFACGISCVALSVAENAHMHGDIGKIER